MNQIGPGAFGDALGEVRSLRETIAEQERELLKRAQTIAKLSQWNEAGSDMAGGRISGSSARGIGAGGGIVKKLVDEGSIHA